MKVTFVLERLISLFRLISENLEIPEETSWVPHPEIGKFFKEYRMTHYYPNHEKMSEYPEDVVVTQKYAREKYGTEHQEESSKNDWYWVWLNVTSMIMLYN